MNILIIGMSNSSHVQNWTRKVIALGHSVDFIESREFLSNTEKISVNFIELRIDKILNFLLKKQNKVKIYLFNLIKKYIDLKHLTENKILKAISNNQYDMVHAIEIQHAGYKLLNVILKLVSFEFKVVITNFGSDIFWYEKNRTHKELINELLKNSNIYICESERDLKIIEKYKFFGKTYKVGTNSGGINFKNLENKNNLQTSLRKIIFVKGNFGFVGRPFNVIDALIQNHELINKLNFEVLIVSAPFSIHETIKTALNNFQIKNKIYKEMELAREDVLNLLLKARIYIGCSLSDGLCTTAIEAMATGAFPIQSDTSTISEHIVHGRDGFVFNPYEIDKLAKYIKESLLNHRMVNKAADRNQKYCELTFDEKIIFDQISKIYKL